MNSNVYQLKNTNSHYLLLNTTRIPLCNGKISLIFLWGNQGLKTTIVMLDGWGMLKADQYWFTTFYNKAIALQNSEVLLQVYCFHKCIYILLLSFWREGVLNFKPLNMLSVFAFFPHTNYRQYLGWGIY